ncbi:hypothetical protein Cst_c06070 [Thermoclostridium stercorarium subsp. stercorarium DSM 8532]|uniref:Uncharacterized protein n=1 Tax=Thermoclostridium stercorarium (strain ATCC 35414 / DSM 8532 / NCIMB 11754) TaxID=1121335 RepID=L7VLZ8_THES1|nr:hypothetical protein Cst_c06070 [Thermoclostridium stercorarium subsp. stercorarium DSM 8532]
MFNLTKLYPCSAAGVESLMKLDLFLLIAYTFFIKYFN